MTLFNFNIMSVASQLVIQLFFIFYFLSVDINLISTVSRRLN
jgi:hypothetical protein